MRLCDEYESTVKKGQSQGAWWRHEVRSCHDGGLRAADEVPRTLSLAPVSNQDQPRATINETTTDCNFFLRLSHASGRQKDWCESNEKALARIGKAVRRMTRRKRITTKLVKNVARNRTLVACILLRLCGSHMPNPMHISVTRS